MPTVLSGCSLPQALTWVAYSLGSHPFPRSEEARLLKAGRSVFSTAFPNPTREGCPSQDLIQALARDNAQLAQHQDFILHMSRCSPCYNDFAKFRKAVQGARRVKVLAAAAIIVVVCAAAWFVERSRHSTTSSYSAVVDFNTHMMFRGFGGSGNQAKGPIVLRRGIVSLTLYLRLGSRTGPYQVGALSESGKPLVTASGTASVEGGRAVLKARLVLSRLNPGHYLLGVRPRGVDWTYCPLIVK